MALNDLPTHVAGLAQSEYEALRTRANRFVNRNWWWMMIVALIVGIVLGLWNPLRLGR